MPSSWASFVFRSLGTFGFAVAGLFFLSFNRKVYTLSAVIVTLLKSVLVYLATKFLGFVPEVFEFLAFMEYLNYICFNLKFETKK